MRIARKRLSLTTLLSQGDSTISALGSAALKEAKRKENRAGLFRLIWAVLVVLCLALTAVALFGSHLIFGSWVPGIFIATILWAVVFGIAILFFLPSKFATTTFGSLLEIGASQVGSGASLISECDKAITSMAQQIGLIAGTKTTDPTVCLLLWVFLIIVTLICLPAFFSG